MTDHDDFGVSVRFKDPRVSTPAKHARPDAVDDSRVLAALNHAAAHRGPGRVRVSVSRVHDELAPSSLRWPMKRLSGVDFVDCDLAGSRIDGGLFSRITIEDCTFERVRLDPFDGSRIDFINCRFDRVDFAGRTDGTLKDSTVLRTDFERCDMRHLDFRRCKIREVTFDRPRMNRTAFRESGLDGVRFVGRLGRAFFTDSRLAGVDFTQAEPAHLQFQGTELSGIQFARRPSSFVVTAPQFRRIAADLVPRASSASRRLLQVYAEESADSVPRPVVVGREMLSAFKDPHDRKLIVDALFPYAIEEIDHLSSS